MFFLIVVVVLFVVWVDWFYIGFVMFFVSCYDFGCVCLVWYIVIFVVCSKLFVFDVWLGYSVMLVFIMVVIMWLLDNLIDGVMLDKILLVIWYMLFVLGIVVSIIVNLLLFRCVMRLVLCICVCSCDVMLISIVFLVLWLR